MEYSAVFHTVHRIKNKLFFSGSGDEKKASVIHAGMNNVEKSARGFKQTVEKNKKIWYTPRMAVYIPDFARLSVQIDQNKQKFERLYALLTEYNERFNLTAITQREEVFHKHFLDSLAGEGLFPEHASAAEVGSGAGFPSLPLKLVRDDLSLTLIESTGKKCEFLKTVVRELGLRQVNVIHARAEELSREKPFREGFDVCFARAVAKLNTLAEYCIPFVRVGGRFVAYKGGADERGEAERAGRELGCAPWQGTAYDLPGGYGARMLVWAEKIKRTPPQYPRGRGKERSAPIV